MALVEEEEEEEAVGQVVEAVVGRSWEELMIFGCRSARVVSDCVSDALGRGFGVMAIRSGRDTTIEYEKYHC